MSKNNSLGIVQYGTEMELALRALKPAGFELTIRFWLVWRD
jgi:hypothetical protein